MMQEMVNEQLKPIGLEIKYLLIEAEQKGRNLDRKSRVRLEQLSKERDELAMDFLFHSY